MSSTSVGYEWGVTFTGIPVAALDFYDDLEQDNTKQFWDANKQTYLDSVQQPMRHLIDQLAPEFGEAKLFRPNRDVRYAKNKAPYKTHQGAFVATGPSTGWYVQVDAAGVMVGAGWYHADSEHLAALRAHIDGDGSRLRRLLASLERAGWSVHGDRVRTTPRGWSADHPFIELLRYKDLHVARRYDNDPLVSTAAFADQVARDWRASRPLLTWAEAA